MSYRRYFPKVRRIYNYQCGYCTVRETDVGGELEIDHFQPIIHGGTDDIENLVYCCPLCNRYKRDFWPSKTDLNLGRRILHPKQDELSTHIREEIDGRLVALTETGRFHIEKLRLNRPALIVLRLQRREISNFRRIIIEANREQRTLHDIIQTLEERYTAALEHEEQMLDNVIELIRQIIEFLKSSSDNND
jgi:hypothetical protein